MLFPLPKSTLFVALFFMGCTTYAQNPLLAAKKFFASEKSAPTNYSLELLSQTENKAVVAAAIHQPSGHTLDVYLHLEKKGKWEVKDVRALAMSGLLQLLKQQLEELTPAQVDSIVNAPPNGKSRMFDSYEDYAYELGHVRLTLASDAEIIKHFREHEAEFELLKTLFLKTENTQDQSSKSLGLDSDLRPQLRKLFLQSVSASTEASPDVILFSIGGILDNTVGYLYAPKAENVPEMSAGGYIAIRNIGNGWYLFKTT